MPKITTNHHWYSFKCRNEVPKKILDDQFDYLDENCSYNSFLKYKGTWYHISDFSIGAPEKWDGYYAHSYSYAVVIKISEDNAESYQIGTWIL